MSAFLRYIRPDENWAAHAAVACDDVDESYQAAWLCDEQPGFPLRTSGTSMAATIANPAGIVDAVVIGHHNLSEGTAVVISGDLDAVLTAPEVPPDRIPVGAYGFVSAGSPNAVESITLTIADHEGPIVIGEVIAGRVRTIRLPLLSSHTQDDTVKALRPEVDVSSVMSYDPGITRRTWGGTYLVTEVELEELRAWYLAQRGLSRPSVLIPDPAINDAWLVSFDTFSRKPVINHQDDPTIRHWMVDLKFVEYPRSRW